jgi:two-component system, cell cycle response regulator
MRRPPKHGRAAGTAFPKGYPVTELIHSLPLNCELQKFHSDSVLVAEDDPLFRRILQTWLHSWGYELTAVDDGTKAWQILQQDNAPELLILDWIMPGVDGLELCRRIRAQPRTPYHYILLVTSCDEKQDVVRGLEAGADDYLTKPFDASELRARLRVGKRILQLQEELISARENLRFHATHDVLTGIWNRAASLDFLRRELQRAMRSGTSTGVLMLDLDHFKNINDQHGHLVGDFVLREVAERINRIVRSYDFVGRYGGEEFLIVLSACSGQDVAQSAERIRAAVYREPILSGAAEIHVTVSIGAAVAKAGEFSEEQILGLADSALYSAKRNGRNRVEMAEPSNQTLDPMHPAS